MTVTEISGVKVFVAPPEGPQIGSEQDALDLLGEAYSAEAEVIAVPAARLLPEFLSLRTGMAGAFLQKMQNYGYSFAVVGDISAAVAGSKALHDFVYESNRTGRMLFATDTEDLARRLAARKSAGR